MGRKNFLICGRRCFLFLLILIFHSLVSSCATSDSLSSRSAIREKYITTSGIIEKGMSQGEVERILGKPPYINPSYGRFQLWQYPDADHRKIKVYFIDGRVEEVLEEGSLLYEE